MYEYTYIRSPVMNNDSIEMYDKESLEFGTLTEIG